MKIRSGFVSNSSSSSFCIYGVSFQLWYQAIEFLDLIKDKGFTIHHGNDESGIMSNIVGIGYHIDISEPNKKMKKTDPSEEEMQKFNKFLEDNKQTKHFVEKCELHSYSKKDKK